MRILRLELKVREEAIGFERKLLSCSHSFLVKILRFKISIHLYKCQNSKIQNFYTFLYQKMGFENSVPLDHYAKLFYYTGCSENFHQKLHQDEQRSPIHIQMLKISKGFGGSKILKKRFFK